MTDPLVLPEYGRVWTIDDLARLPDDGNRYEIVDGSLLVTPPPSLPHGSTVYYLRRRVDAQAPPGFGAVENLGVDIEHRRTFYIPDLMVIRETTLARDGDSLHPHEVLVVVQVLSRGSGGRDKVLKRHDYARVGIPQYWIVDHLARTLTILTLDDQSYVEQAVVKAGETWRTDRPFPLSLDPAEFC